MPSKRATKKNSSQSKLKKSKKNMIRSQTRKLIGGAQPQGRGRRNRRQRRNPQQQQQQQQQGGPNPNQQQPRQPNQHQQHGQHRGQPFGFQGFQQGDPRAQNQQFRGQQYQPQQDPYYGMTRNERQKAKVYESKRKGKSSGKTLNKKLMRIQSRLKKAYCRVKTDCNQYPMYETTQVLNDFLAQLKTMNTLISRVNKDRDSCKNISVDRKKNIQCMSLQKN